MENEQKIKFFGEFNQAKDTLIRAQKQLQYLWNDGATRLRADDIEDIAKSEREMRGLLKQISAIKELFLGISNGKIEE